MMTKICMSCGGDREEPPRNNCNQPQNHSRYTGHARKPLHWRCDMPTAFPLAASQPHCRRYVRWKGDRCFQHRGDYVPMTQAARITALFDDVFKDEGHISVTEYNRLKAIRTAVLEILG